MTFLPPPQPGYLPSTHTANARGIPPAARLTSQIRHVPDREVVAPTLGQYFRSDSRDIPGRARPKWAGRVAFWLGMAAAVLFVADMLFVAGQPGLLAAIAAPLAVVAFLSGLIAVIAGVGRGLGIFGLIFALAGSTLFWQWLERTFG